MLCYLSPESAEESYKTKLLIPCLFPLLFSVLWQTILVYYNRSSASYYVFVSVLTGWLAVLVFKYLSRKVNAITMHCSGFLRDSSVVTFSPVRCIISLWSSPKNIKDYPWICHVCVGPWKITTINNLHLFQWVKYGLCLYMGRKCSQMSFIVEHGSF